ncbi:MAG: hypothetical protein ABMA25_04730 [Ilumatobacteraceae bacterium]
MSLDDELRRRLQQAADQAGAGTDPAALTHQVTKQAAVGARPPFRLLGAIGAVGLVAGGALGFTALQPADDTNAGGFGATVNVQRYSMYDCPDGAAVGTVYPGDRVYVIGRNDAADWVEVRDPRDQTQQRWLPAVAVDPDAVRDVPVVPCNEEIALTPAGASTTTIETTTTSTVPETTTSTTIVETTVPTTVPATVPPTPPPTPAPDTQQPIVAQGTRSPAEIYDGSWSSYCDISSALTVVATDNVGVTQVTGSYAGLGGSPIGFVKGSGNTWTATFGPFVGLPGSYSQDIVISIVAKDAAGNTSTATTVTVHVWGTCLI